MTTSDSPRLHTLPELADALKLLDWRPTDAQPKTLDVQEHGTYRVVLGGDGQALGVGDTPALALIHAIEGWFRSVVGADVATVERHTKHLRARFNIAEETPPASQVNQADSVEPAG